jgi:SAM-dependent methyltransferase
MSFLDGNLASRLCSSVLAEVHLQIESFVRDPGSLRGLRRPLSFLDVGCSDGANTVRYAELLGAPARGIEIFDQPSAAARARGVEVAQIDLERDRFPWPDESMDLVIANQVFEHLKNVWLAMAEMHRVLKPGGALIVSVPNLASLHNRVLLAFGMQPTSIRTFGPHVRGFTRREFEEFIALEAAFRVERSEGVGFYPFAARWSRPFARLWPGASHTLLVLARKGSTTARWLNYLDGSSGVAGQTSYAGTRSGAA